MENPVSLLYISNTWGTLMGFWIGLWLTLLHPIHKIEIHPNGAWIKGVLSISQPGTLSIILPPYVDTHSIRWNSSAVTVLSYRWRSITLPDTSLPPVSQQYRQLLRNLGAIHDSLNILAAEETLRILSIRNAQEPPDEILSRFRSDMTSLYTLRRHLEDREAQISQAIQDLRSQGSLLDPTRWILHLRVKGKGKLFLRYWIDRAGWDLGLMIYGQPFQPTVHLALAAELHQSTGFDWENIPAVLDNRSRDLSQPQPAPPPKPWVWFPPIPKQKSVESRAQIEFFEIERQTLRPQLEESGFILRLPLPSLSLPTGETRILPIRDTVIPARWFIEVRRDQPSHVALSLSQPFPYALPRGFLEVQLTGMGQARGETPPWPVAQPRTFWVQGLPDIPFRWEMTNIQIRHGRTSDVEERTYQAVLTNPYGTPMTFRILLPQPYTSDPSVGKIHSLWWDPQPDSTLNIKSAPFGVWWRTLQSGDSLILRLHFKISSPEVKGSR